MWDQWLQSMAGTATIPSTSKLVDSPHTSFSRLRAVLSLMEWWRWSLILVGLMFLFVGLTLLIKSGQANGVQATSSEGNELNQIELSSGANSLNLSGSTSSTALSATTSTTTDQTQPSQPSQSAAQSTEHIYLDVAGAVVNPGVHLVEKSSRAGAAVAAAGGLSKHAHQLYLRKYFNAAAPIHDGQKIYIPFADEDLDASENSAAVLSTVAASDNQFSLISINTATSKQLDTLPGIGTVRAEQIIAGRPYQRLEELDEKQILTTSIYEGLAGLISL